MASESLIPAIAALLAASGNEAEISEYELLPAGGNNRVYRVRAGGRDFAAKHYFHDLAEPRDRLGSEYGFLRHAWHCGIRCVPEPLAADAANHLALYEYVAGRKPTATEITLQDVLEAADFFAILNSQASHEAGNWLPQASDACFTVEEHVRSVDRRLDRLVLTLTGSAVEREAADFVAHLANDWKAARERILRQASSRTESSAWRSISASDFGFHNALVRETGELSFLDFEYAGWDDPAKMAGDFFWHAGIRPPRQYFERFAEAAFARFADAARIVERVQCLSPAFRTRWACIALNEFLPDSARRRRFASSGEESVLEARKLAQLAKARALFGESDF